MLQVPRGVPVIASAMGLIARQLNEGLRRSLQTAEDPVVLSGLVDSDGGAAPQVTNKLAIFLVNVERELSSRAPGRVDTSGSRIGLKPPPVNLNLLLMFAANFNSANYAEALKFLAGTVAFFQARPVIDHRNSPELERDIERLVLELEPLSLTDLSNLWGILGGHYVPSVMYRVRMLTIDAESIIGQAPAITRPDTAVGG
jgi:hypothetical protein